MDKLNEFKRFDFDTRDQDSWHFLSKEEIESRSLKSIQKQISWVIDNSPYYKKILKDFDPMKVTFDNFLELPFTDKNMLTNYLDEFQSVPDYKIVETVLTSGSSGDPLVFQMTMNDLDRLALNEIQSFSLAGVLPGDRAQILVSLDRLFIAGSAYYRGLTQLGVNTFRVGVVPVSMNKFYFEKFNPTVIVGVPTFLKNLGQELSNIGYDTRKSSVKKIFCIGESIRNKNLTLNVIGNYLEELYQADVYSTYASTETAVSYCECIYKSGNHVHQSLVYIEIIDEQGKLLPDGHVGELVVTPLGVTGMPLIRYKTGDMTFKISGNCNCGRNSTRIGPILSRKAHMIKYKGTTIYPASITNVLDAFQDIKDYLLILKKDEFLSDEVQIFIDACASFKKDEIGNMIQSVVRIKINLNFVENSIIQEMRKSFRKHVKIIDQREF